MGNLVNFILMLVEYNTKEMQVFSRTIVQAKEILIIHEKKGDKT